MSRRRNVSLVLRQTGSYDDLSPICDVSLKCRQESLWHHHFLGAPVGRPQPPCRFPKGEWHRRLLPTFYLLRLTILRLLQGRNRLLTHPGSSIQAAETPPGLLGSLPGRTSAFQRQNLFPLPRLEHNRFRIESVQENIHSAHSPRKSCVAPSANSRRQAHSTSAGGCWRIISFASSTSPRSLVPAIFRRSKRDACSAESITCMFRTRSSV